MKALFIFFIFSQTLSYCQIEWTPIGAKWWYAATDFSHVEKFESVEEVVIGGKSCKKIVVTTPFSSVSYFYTCEEGGKIYRANPADSTFRLHLDFNKQPGESWVSAGLSDTLICYVDSISWREVGNQSLQVQHIRVYNPANGIETWSEIIDGVGSIHSPFLPYPTNLTPEIWYLLACYESPATGLATISYVAPGVTCEGLTTRVGEVGGDFIRERETNNLPILARPFSF